MKYVRKASFKGLRQLSGTVKFSPGLNIILGPNNAGKTALLESVIIPLLLNYANTIESYTFLHIYEAARGSLLHAFYSLANKEARSCINISNSIENSSTGCASITISDAIESIGDSIVNVAKITMRSETRDCSITYIFKSNGQISININGNKCVESDIRFAAIPSGVMPYNGFDTIIGALKRTNPKLVDSITVNFGDDSYRLDLGVDALNRAVVLVKRNNNETSVFYSIGRGLQRTFQILFMTLISDIILVDEIESAMHPELMTELSSKLVKYMEGKQVILTSQSIEAITALASAVIDPNNVTSNRFKLSQASRDCSDNKLKVPIRLIILTRRDNYIVYMAYDGCDAIDYIAGSRDPRLSFVLLSPS